MRYKSPLEQLDEQKRLPRPPRRERLVAVIVLGLLIASYGVGRFILWQADPCPGGLPPTCFIANTVSGLVGAPRHIIAGLLFIALGLTCLGWAYVVARYDA
jgi:hypothetical protein